MTRVRVRLVGDEAQLGRVNALDVARLLQGFERAVARAAAGIAGRRPGLSGRRGKGVEAATRLILGAIEPGSVTAVLDLPEQVEGRNEFDLEDLGLGDAALAEMLDVLEANRENRDVAEALASLAEDLDIGGRFDILDIELEQSPITQRRATLDASKRRRLRSVADSSDSRRPDALYGVLFEANFERQTAQLRLPSGQAVSVAFSEHLAEDVKRALRERSHLQGVVSYDAATSEVTSVELRTVLRAEQQELGLSGGDFWRERSVEELAAEQGVEPLTEPRDLRDLEASPEEVAALFEALGS